MMQRATAAVAASYRGNKGGGSQMNLVTDNATGAVVLEYESQGMAEKDARSALSPASSSSEQVRIRRSSCFSARCIEVAIILNVLLNGVCCY